jgi:hypothetical protein
VLRGALVVESEGGQMTVRDGDQELIGSIELDPAIRPPRDNGDRDAEVLLAVGAIESGPELDPVGNGEAVFLQA